MKLTAVYTDPEMACLGMPKGTQPSPLGLQVVHILSVVFRGLHHIDPWALEKAEWSNNHHISVDFKTSQFATHDYNELTQLVVMAHDACVRVGISSPAMKTIRLIFHQRTRTGNYCQRHPTLEDAAAEIRKQYTISEEEAPNPTV